MSDFTTEIPTQGPLHPYTRVRYPMGLVLGPDEFTQEQLYLMERDRLHNRALHGYGTIYGLNVAVHDSADGPEVMVSPGLAVDPTGQTIRVPSAQCAKLPKWLTRYQKQVEARFGTPPHHVTLYVVLCYRECKTTMVPIRVGPCHSLEDSMAPSRIADDFALSLRLDPPAQVEEEVIRHFGALLGRIEITSEPGSFVTQADMEAYVRGLAAGSPPPASPPESGASLRLHPDEACDILRSAFRVWATEVRPTLLATESKAGMTEPDTSSVGFLPAESVDDACVLLGRLDFGVNASGEVAGPVSINDDQRPVLLHTRLLQEWLLCGRLGRTAERGNTRTFVTLFVHNPTTIRAWIHHPVLLALPREAVTIEIDAAPMRRPAQPRAVTQLVPGTNVFDLALSGSLEHGSQVVVRFDADSISEVTRPVRTLTRALQEQEYTYLDWDGGTLRAYLSVNLPALDDMSDVHAPAPGNGQVLTWNSATRQWEPQPHVHALDDLTDVNAPAPATGHVLTRQGEQWVAAAPPTGVSDHGALSGREDDDHPQYFNVARGDVRYAPLNHSHTLDALSDVNAPAPGNGQVLTWQGGQWIAAAAPAGVSDHGALSGREDDDHPQYLTADRGDRRYVRAPAGPFAIVAAGFFAVDGAPQGIGPYNDLTAQRLNNRDYLLNFRRYDFPAINSNRIMYIVKGTVQESSRQSVRHTFAFVAFQDNGILVRIAGTNDENSSAGFMVEISQYPFG